MTKAANTFWWLILCATAAGPLEATAQAWPARAIRLVTDGSAGGGGDVLARIVTAEMAKLLGQSLVIENRPGAGGTLAPPVVMRSPADGYTILQVTISAAANVTLRQNLPYDLLRDFAPLSQVASGPAVVVVHPSLPAKSVKQLVALAKARPGDVTYASAGAGSSTFLAAELFNDAAGVNLAQVAYRGGSPALVGVMTGETAVMFAPLGSSLSFIRQKTLIPLAVTTGARVPAVPDIPTVAESGVPGYEFNNWYGWFVRSGTPPQPISAVHRALAAALQQPEVISRLRDMGYLPVASPPEEFARHVKADVERLAKALQKAKSAPQ